jgi:3-deoxy-D-manno-octulosonic-acid transferase
MSFVYDILYTLGFLLAVPFLAIKSWRTGKYRSGWAARFGRYATPPTPKVSGQKRLMFHCVSVGELLSVRHLVDSLLQDPSLFVVLTTTTDTGTARAAEIYSAPRYQGRVATYRYPLDFSFAVRRFLRHARPDLVALVELETWPNFVRLAGKKKIPVIVINGRLTARALSRYNLVKPIIADMFRRLAWLGIQTETIAQRFRSLGAPADRITLIPTLKYDTADLSDTLPGSDAFARACGILPHHTLLVGGSTGPGEEVYLLEAYTMLRQPYPNLRLAIAPRKPETVPGTLTAIKAAGLQPILRTDRPDSAETSSDTPLSSNDILVLNTMGELKKLYSLSFASFVGRSLVPLGGSDMIEVAALAKPCCFGPFTANFAEAVELLTTPSAATALKSPAELHSTFEVWLANPAAAAAMGRRAREVIAAQRGSTAAYIEKLQSFLAASSVSSS